jgi:hypothetical protein
VPDTNNAVVLKKAPDLEDSSIFSVKFGRCIGIRYGYANRLGGHHARAKGVSFDVDCDYSFVTQFQDPAITLPPLPGLGIY